MASSATTPGLPAELWLSIKDHLPELSKHLITHVPDARNKGLELTRKDRHRRIWSLIFKDERWLSAMVKQGLNPVLIGYDLHSLYDAEDITAMTESNYLALVLGHDGDGGKYNKPDVSNQMELLIKSLNHSKTGEQSEKFFLEGRLILNIRDAMYNHHYTTMSHPDRLLSPELESLQSAYLYWNDKLSAVQTIGPEKIVGIEKVARTKKSGSIFGLEWEHVLVEKRTSRQHFFQTPGMEVYARQIDNGQRGNSFKVTGWKWWSEFVE